MSKRRRRELRDVYRFPGFAPRAAVHGVFGDRMAIVVTLTRRRKKRHAVSAAGGIGATTTSGSVASGTCRAAMSLGLLNLGGGWGDQYVSFLDGATVAVEFS